MSEPTTTTPAPTPEEIARTVTAYANRLNGLRETIRDLDDRLEAVEEQMAAIVQALNASTEPTHRAGVRSPARLRVRWHELRAKHRPAHAELDERAAQPRTEPTA